MRYKGYYEPQNNEPPVWLKVGCFLLGVAIVGLFAVLFWVNLYARAADAPAVTAETAQSAGLTGTQTIQAAANDVLPTDEPEFYAVASAESNALPQDEPVSNSYILAPAGAPIYETDSEAAAPTKSYNGISEGSTINAVLTYYDVCLSCCGSTQGVTASGRVIYNGMDNPYVAACNWLPLGSIISIGGVEYTVADRGGDSLNTVGRVDVFVPEGHSAAVALGRSDTTITVVKIGGGAG